VLQGIVGGVVGAEFRVEVADNSDADSVGHGAILIEPCVPDVPAWVRSMVRRHAGRQRQLEAIRKLIGLDEAGSRSLNAASARP
jgi:hypothetical protein